MKTLRQILQEHGTDKETYHSYGPVYEKLFAPFRETVTSILEIGIFQGQSLRAWKEYFSSAWIVGIDRLYECMLFDEKKIYTICANSTDPHIIKILRNNEYTSFDNSIFTPFNIIIDDGSHNIVDQLITKTILWQFLETEGLYIIEDIQNYNLATLLFEQDPDLIQIYSGPNSKDDTLAIFRKK